MGESSFEGGSENSEVPNAVRLVEDSRTLQDRPLANGHIHARPGTMHADGHAHAHAAPPTSHAPAHAPAFAHAEPVGVQTLPPFLTND